MPQPRLWFSQAVVSCVPFCIAVLRPLLFRLFKTVSAVRMHGCGKRKEFFLERIGIEPWAARFVENSKIVRHYALKLSPHEQLVAAFGFCTLKPPCNESR